MTSQNDAALMLSTALFNMINTALSWKSTANARHDEFGRLSDRTVENIVFSV